MKNILAYQNTELIKAAKRFIVQALKNKKNMSKNFQGYKFFLFFSLKS